MTQKLNRHNLASSEQTLLMGAQAIARGKATWDKQSRELLELQQQYVDLVENMNSAMAVCKAVDDGQDFVFVNFNRSGERIDNISRDEVIGRDVLKVFPMV